MSPKSFHAFHLALSFMLNIPGLSVVFLPFVPYLKYLYNSSFSSLDNFERLSNFLTASEAISNFS